MRTTFSIADDILRDLKALSKKRKQSLTETANFVLRKGLAVASEPTAKSVPYREETVDMGMPQVELTKALLLASQLEDAEVVRKLQLRK